MVSVSELTMGLFRKSEQVIMDMDDHSCRVSVPKSENTVHYVQFCQPLTRERRFFFVELENISMGSLDPLMSFLHSLSGDECEVIIGVASSKHDLNEAPGFSHDTVGYNSSNGHLYTNRKDSGNMRGHRCRQGDTMGVEIDVFNKEMSVVLFSKNFRPIGTRYLTLTEHDQYFPTILIESHGDPVDLSVYWQTRVSLPTHYSVVSEGMSDRFCFISNFLLEKSRGLVFTRAGQCRFPREDVPSAWASRSFSMYSSTVQFVEK